MRGVANLIQGRIKIATPGALQSMPDVVPVLEIFHDSDVFLVHAAAAKTGTSLAE
jgi:hypothetical protein